MNEWRAAGEMHKLTVESIVAGFIEFLLKPVLIL